MIGRGMANIIKRLARHRDDMRLANFQRVRGLDAKWKLLRCPIEYCLPNLTPLWANRNLGANRSDVVSGLGDNTVTQREPENQSTDSRDYCRVATGTVSSAGAQQIFYCLFGPEANKSSNAFLALRRA